MRQLPLHEWAQKPVRFYLSSTFAVGRIYFGAFWSGCLDCAKFSLAQVVPSLTYPAFMIGGESIVVKELTATIQTDHEPLSNRRGCA